ncbi:MAG: SPOR domain-containing protein [Exilispira sp.]
MSEKFDDFEKIDKIDKNNYNSFKRKENDSLKTLKIIAIVFILLLSTAISAYLVISYFQNTKISFSKEITKKDFDFDNNSENIIKEEEIEKKEDIVDSDDYNKNSTNDLIAKDQKIINNIVNQPVEIQSQTSKQTNSDSKNSISSNNQSKQKSITLKTYIIQVASFTDFDKAISLKNKLEKNGISSYIVIVEINGKYYYRVRCGKFTDKKEAENLILKIKSIDNSLNPIIFIN